MMDDKTNMSAPAVKFPPPLLYIGAMLAGGLLDHFLPIPGIAVSSTILKPLGSILFLAGVVVNLAALMQFRRQKENPIPWTGSEQIIAEGIYKITRNPMYFGMTLIALGAGLFFASYAIVGLGLLASITIDRLVILREEVYLEQRFGQSYADYKRRVRRWI